VRTLLRNARIVLPERVLDSGALLIENGRFAQIVSDQSVNPGHVDSIIDLDGATLFPGFIDLHIHGSVGVDVNSATAADLRRVSEFLATKGVTWWLPTLVPAAHQEYTRAVEAISEVIRQQQSSEHRLQLDTSAEDPTKVGALNPGYARVLGVHYEGPFVNNEQCGALHREHFRSFKTGAELDSLPAVGNEKALHMMTVAPEIDGGIDLIRELRRRGWIVSLGHTRATPDVLDQAKAAGAQHMTHFMNAMPPFHHRAPGPVGWGLLNDEVSLDVIADGVHLDPIMLKVLLRNVTPSRLALISDAIAATGRGDGDYEIWGEKIAVENGRTRNVHGSIAGSVITMLDAVKMMLSLGASECDVARMASMNPARLLGIDRDFGSIEEGKRADLFALNERGEAQLTVIEGQASSPRK
jgi:N-acetylglucosamine-6-phosphate deacetylase